VALRRRLPEEWLLPVGQQRKEDFHFGAVLLHVANVIH